MKLDTAEVSRLMEDNVLDEHGCVNLREVECIIKTRGADATETLLDFLESDESQARGALPLLYSLAQRDELSAEQAMRLVPFIERFGSVDSDAYYDAIDALCNQKYVNVMMKLLQNLFDRKNHRDWRWIGYSIISAMLNGQVKFQMFPKFAYLAIGEAYKERDRELRDKMIFLAGRLEENQKLYLS